MMEEIKNNISPLDILYSDEEISRIKELTDIEEMTNNSNFEFIIIDIDKRNIAKRDIREVLDEKETVKYSELGFKFNISSIKDTEKFTSTFFKLNGFIVLRSTARNIDFFDCFENKQSEDIFKKEEEEKKLVVSYLKDKYLVDDFNSLIKAGIPDFLAYKKENSMIKELFFIEVKKRIDSLRFEQMIWLFSNKIPTKIVVL